MCSEDPPYKIYLRRHTEDVHRLTTERNYYIEEESRSDMETD
jgi:hypothetical protein